MQSKIENSQSSIHNASLKVRNVLKRLEAMEREANAQISYLNSEVKRLILES